jgi:hypothetical protein
MTGWRSAGDLASLDDVEPEPWERTVEDPTRLAQSEAQRVRRGREKPQEPRAVSIEEEER